MPGIAVHMLHRRSDRATGDVCRVGARPAQLSRLVTAPPSTTEAHGHEFEDLAAPAGGLGLQGRNELGEAPSAAEAGLQRLPRRLLAHLSLLLGQRLERRLQRLPLRTPPLRTQRTAQEDQAE